LLYWSFHLRWRKEEEEESASTKSELDLFPKNEKQTRKQTRPIALMQISWTSQLLEFHISLSGMTSDKENLRGF